MEQLASVIKDTLVETATYFGKNHSYLYAEGDLRCILFSHLMQKQLPGTSDGAESGIPVIHAEWPTMDNPRSHYDLVILSQGSHKMVSALQGQSGLRFDTEVPAQAAIEVKFWHTGASGLGGLRMAVRKLVKFLGYWGDRTFSINFIPRRLETDRRLSVTITTYCQLMVDRHAGLTIAFIDTEGAPLWFTNESGVTR